MSIACEQVKTITVPGSLDQVAADTFGRVVREAIASRPRLVRLDCRSMERIVSSHITLLWTARELCHRSGVAMELSEPPDALVRILNVLDLAGIFEYDRQLSQAAPAAAPITIPSAAPTEFRAQPCANSDSIDHAIIEFLVYLNQLHIDRSTALELQTLVYELATNVRIHSGLGSDATFDLHVMADPRQLTITITDSGCAFDPSAGGAEFDPGSASRSGQKRGFGLPMIRRLADDLDYRRTDDSRNILTITKRWR